MLSHSSAAWLWGAGRTCPLPVEVTVPRGGRRRSAIRVHQAAALGNEDRAVVAHTPVTSVPRTLLDLAATIPPGPLQRAIERSEQLELFDLRHVDSLLSRNPGHPGADRLRRALKLYREPAFTRSALERQFLALVRRAGLPRPAVNVFVEGFELDMYWEDERFAVELDGYEYHRTRAAFERDRLRHEELKLAGIEMIRLTARRLDHEPDVVVKRLATLLDRRRATRRQSPEGRSRRTDRRAPAPPP